MQRNYDKARGETTFLELLILAYGRLSDQTAFFYEGHLIEVGATNGLFTNPNEKQTEDCITGRFG